MEAIAKEYAANGIEYTEIFFGKITDPDFLAMIHEHAPRIERETCVKLRFLAAVSRLSTKAERDIAIEKIDALALKKADPYIALGLIFLEQKQIQP